MRRWGAVAVVGLGLVAGACGDDAGSDGTVVATDAPTAVERLTEGDVPLGLAEATIEHLTVDDFADLPAPSGDDVAIPEHLVLTALDGGAAFLGPGGSLLRLGEEADVEVTEGIAPGEDEPTVRSLAALASDGFTLLAIGEAEVVADDVARITTYAWQSEDGDDWEGVEPDGLESDRGPVTITALVADPAGGWLAGGAVEDGDQTVLTLWHSDDGESWEEVDAPGLDQTEDEDSGERLVDLVVIDDTVLVVREDEGLDDLSLELVRGTFGGEFVELEPTGLDVLDLPNTDIIPPATAVDTSFVLFASTPLEEGEEFGDRRPALFTSEDGEAWEAVEFDGPVLSDGFAGQAIVGTDAGAIGVSAGEDSLDIWRFTDG